MQALVFEADGSKELRTVLKQHVKASTVCNHPRQKPAEITSTACDRSVLQKTIVRFAHVRCINCINPFNLGPNS